VAQVQLLPCVAAMSRVLLKSDNSINVVKDFQLHHSIDLHAICVMTALAQHDMVVRLIASQVAGGARVSCTKHVQTSQYATLLSFGLHM
jgi:hypothetical protein